MTSGLPCNGCTGGLLLPSTPTGRERWSISINTKHTNIKAQPFFVNCPHWATQVELPPLCRELPGRSTGGERANPGEKIVPAFWKLIIEMLWCSSNFRRQSLRITCRVSMHLRTMKYHTISRNTIQSREI